MKYKEKISEKSIFPDERKEVWEQRGLFASASSGGTVVNNSLPMREMQEKWVQFLDQEDPLEKEMATHSSILAWKIPWIEEPGGLESMELQRVGHRRLSS